LRGGWPAYALQRIRILAREWRSVAEKVARACRQLFGDKCLGVYVVGSVAEDRITVLSDLDVVLVVGEPQLKTLENLLAVKREAEKQGVPPEITLDIKLLTPQEFDELVKRGVYRKYIPITLSTPPSKAKPARKS
jgi:predicted nucleotidyltransferase